MPYFGKVSGSGLEELATNTIRIIAAEGVQKANSGHPGLPMGSADIAHVLWTRFMQLDNNDPEWINRDRFVLSAGHGSMLLYTLLHLGGFGVSLEDLKNFRQLGSLTPGHPEYGHTPGIDTTTGPLGAGFSNAVGFAIAEEMLAKRFNSNEFKLINHYTYTLCGDGCMMEGITSEAASLAGHLRLGKLICFYDDNEISIEGNTNLAFTEDVNKRFAAYAWQVQDIDGHDHEAIANAIENAQAETKRPSLIVCHTTIGKGSPNKAGSASAHGEPLGIEELAITKNNLGWPRDKDFVIPEAVRELWQEKQNEWRMLRTEWNKVMDAFCQKHTRLAKAFDRAVAGELPRGYARAIKEFPSGKAVATRSSGGEIINSLAEVIPELVGGSADLAPSTKTVIKSADFIAPGKFAGRNLHFGVREHAMAGVVNGLTLHGGFIPFCATFMVFVDYMRPAIRLAALMQIRVIFYLTHDSIFVGEDGPTHQPVEHLAGLRIIPNLNVMRPCDANEAAVCFISALENKKTPTVFAMTRQNLMTLDREECAPALEAKKGGYILKEAPNGRPDLLLLASGSEVHLALAAYEELVKSGKQPRVVSMPCLEIFNQQKDAYKRKVLPKRIKERVAIEASLEPAWRNYVGDKGLVIGMNGFGLSGPGEKLAERFGFTLESVMNRLKEVGFVL